MDGRAKSDDQGDKNMQKPLQWSRIDATGKTGGRDGSNCQAAAAHRLGTSASWGDQQRQSLVERGAVASAPFGARIVSEVLAVGLCTEPMVVTGGSGCA